MPSVVTYSAAKAGLLLNSYLLDTGDGSAVVDTGLLRSDAPVHAVADEPAGRAA